MPNLKALHFLTFAAVSTTRTSLSRLSRRRAAGWQLAGAWLLGLLCLLLALWLPAAPAVAAPRWAPVLPQCSWDRPGHNPYTGDLVAAVDHYTDIPPAVRARLKQRMAARQYDEIVQIRRDRIEGQHSYQPTIRDMHFGDGQVCREVSRARWADTALERGLVYCDGGHCLLVPTVCRNLSRIQQMAGSRPSGTGHANSANGLPEDVLATAVLLDPQAPLVFDPPGAGLPSAAAPAPSVVDATVAADGSLLAGAAAPLWGGLLPSGGGATGAAGGGSWAADAVIPPANTVLPGGATPGAGGGTSLGTGGGVTGGSGGGGGATGPGWGGGGGGVPEAIATQLPAVIAPVPEPETWALMLLGVLAVGVQRRRSLML